MRICPQCSKNYERGLFCECGADLIDKLEETKTNDKIATTSKDVKTTKTCPKCSKEYENGLFCECGTDLIDKPEEMEIVEVVDVISSDQIETDPPMSEIIMAGSNSLSRPPIPKEILAGSTQRKDVFRAEIAALQDSIGINHNSHFIEQILKKYEWNDENRQEIRAKLKDILQRKDDPRLFVGVIGEFAGGKSTLINALIREELLKTDVLPATTSAITLLSYGDKLDAEVYFKDKQRKVYSKDGTSWIDKIARLFSKNAHEEKGIWNFVQSCSAEENIAKNVIQVNIYHSLPVFKQGLVVIDTPGTNVENPRHIQVTQQAIHEICDAAIVIIPADIPVSQTLQRFLKTHLHSVLHRCIFVVTKIDFIQERERPRLLTSIQAILQRELGLSSPQVVGIAPRLFLDHLVGVDTTEKTESFVAQFKQAEENIYKTLQANKMFIILEKVSILFSTLLNQLNEKLQERSRQYQQKHEALERNRIPNLANFVKDRKRKYAREFQDSVMSIPNRLPDIVSDHQDNVLELLAEDVESATSKEDLKNILERKPRERMASVQSQMNSDITKLQSEIQQGFKEQLRYFEVEFTKLYQSLAILEDSSTKTNLPAIVNAEISAHIQNQVDMSIQGVKAAIDAEGSSIGTGIGVGLGLGILTGGLAILLLPFFGGVLGSLFGPSLDQVKQKVLDDLLPRIKDSFSEFERAATQKLDEIVKSKAIVLEDTIERYFEVYGRKVNEMIARDEAEKSRLIQYQDMIEIDLGQIRHRLEQLEQVRNKLRTLGH